MGRSLLLDIVREELDDIKPILTHLSPDETRKYVRGKVFNCSLSVLHLFNIPGFIHSLASDQIEQFETLDDDLESNASVDDNFSDPEADEDQAEISSQSSYEPSPEKTLRSQEGTQVDDAQKLKILTYWRSLKDGKKRKWTHMQSHYSELRAWTSDRVLYNWQAQLGKTAPNRQQFVKLNSLLGQKFRDKRKNGFPVHDDYLRRWALELNETIGIPGFKASPSWLSKWKKRHNARSLKITHFVTNDHVQKSEKLEIECDRFISRIRKHMERFDDDHIYNTDQSGFEKELHLRRTIEERGTRKVVSIAQSKSAMTHRYTIMPTISMSGRLLPKLFIVAQEPNSQFGPKVSQTMFRHQSLIVAAHSSGKVTKSLLKTWYNDVFLSQTDGENVLLLDALSSYSAVREEIEQSEDQSRATIFEQIPPQTTGMIQPCDTYFFRHWKTFYRRLHDHVIAEQLQTQLHQRDNFMKVQVLINNQFCSPRYVNFIKYAWFKSGFKEEGPEHVTPVQFSFKDIMMKKCDHCPQYIFIKCGWCAQSLCFNHFFDQLHVCDQYNP